MLYSSSEAALLPLVSFLKRKEVIIGHRNTLKLATSANDIKKKHSLVFTEVN